APHCRCSHRSTTSPRSPSSSIATAPVSSRWPTGSPTSRGSAPSCATRVCGCSTTPRAAAPRSRRSTSSTPRTPAASWSNSSSPPGADRPGAQPPPPQAAPDTAKPPVSGAAHAVSAPVTGNLTGMSYTPDTSSAVSAFSVVRRGFDRDQVSEHIRRLEAELRLTATDRDAAAAQSADLAAQLDDARDEIDQLHEEIDRLSVPPTTAEGMSER